jgi:two-component system chemotaxis sensor kinase CheA
MQRLNSETLEVLARLADKIALELVFADPGKDQGLLPINNLLGQMDEAAAGNALPTVLTDGLCLARQWVDHTFERDGKFNADTLQRLSDWSQWLQSAAQSCIREQAIPPMPASLTAAASATEAAPEAPAPELPVAEESLQLNLEDDAELLAEFINESEEHLQNIEQGVLVLEEHPTDADTLNSIFRAFHTFKGSAGFLNLKPIQRLAHELESLLGLARQDRLAIDSEVINVILAGGDTLKKFVQEIRARLDRPGNHAPLLVPTAALLKRVVAILSSIPEVESATEPARTEATPVGAATAAPAIPTPAAPPTVGEISHTENASEESRSGSKGGNVKTATSFVKVDTQKLDSLVDMVGEMVIVQSLVTQDQGLQDLMTQRLSRNLSQLLRITRDLQRISMSLRMVPIRSTFQKMTRLVRDVSLKSEKQVVLHLSGEETELDRTIVEQISDPLIHMIRNSVDHGIEKAETRLAAGKPPFGSIWLRAFHQGGSIVIEIKDDGAGLNKERILAKAVEKGMVAPHVEMSEKEIFNLIFAAGFSTAEKVTAISGRGVGMDVVRKNIERLRGKIDIQSTQGQGSTFTIYLPLTLAIIDGLLVGVGQERFILPTLSVCESFRPSPAMLSTVRGTGEVVNVRGNLLPLLRLHEHFGIEPRARRAEEGIVVVVESNNQKRCLLVDELLGKQEVVIKSLGEGISTRCAVSGAAILGDGRVGLILDSDALVHLKSSAFAQAA